MTVTSALHSSRQPSRNSKRTLQSTLAFCMTTQRQKWRLLATLQRSLSPPPPPSSSIPVGSIRQGPSLFWLCVFCLFWLLFLKGSLCFQFCSFHTTCEKKTLIWIQTCSAKKLFSFFCYYVRMINPLKIHGHPTNVVLSQFSAEKI